MLLRLATAFIFYLFGISLALSQGPTNPNQLDYFKQTIFIKATVESNRLSSKDVILMLDTGTKNSTLDMPTIEYLGLRNTGTFTNHGPASVTVNGKFLLPKLSVRGRAVKNLQVQGVRDNAFASQIYKRPIGGILGMDFLTGYVVTIDFCQSTIDFSKEMPKHGPMTTFVLSIVETLPEISAELPTKKKVKLLFDTGFDAAVDASLFKPAVPYITLTPPVKSTSLGDQNGQISSADGRIGYIKLSNTWEIAPAKVRLADKVSATYPDLKHAGQIGLGPFTRGLLIMDFKNNSLLVSPKPVCALRSY